MKIALAQMNVHLGNIETNFNQMRVWIEEAKQKDCKMIIFPELCIGGYLLGDRWLEDSFCQNLMMFNQKMQELSQGIIIIYGNIYFDQEVYRDGGWHPNKDGRVRKYNAVYVFQNGYPAKRHNSISYLPDGVQPKTLLPNYRIFDDERYFFSMQDIAKDYGRSIEDLYSPFEITIEGKTLLIGCEVCEDLWCMDYRYNQNPVNPTKYLVNNGAELIINISASPWTYQKNDARDRRVKFLKEELGKNFVPFLYVNNTGAQNNGKNIVTFDGGTTVYNTNAEPIIFDTAFQEELMIVESETFGNSGIKRPPSSKIAQKFQAIQTGVYHLKDILGWKNHPRFVLGLSGGIDSSVVAAILVAALGNDHVMGINMPSKYNSKKTRSAAEKLAKALQIKYQEYSIEKPHREVVKALEEIDFVTEQKDLSQLNRENIQAKIRGTDYLSNIAAKYGALFTNNGNKLEIALGYATLYGDVGGAIAPIGDLTKDEVYEMAIFLNNEIFKAETIPIELIPDNLFQFSPDQIPPSAELKEDQIDPMKFGYHDAILTAMTDFNKKTAEDFAMWFLEGTLHTNLHISFDLLVRWDLLKPQQFISDLEWFMKLYYGSIFKRVQAPPIIITSKSAFGYDIRESQVPWFPSQQYKDLKQQVLSLSSYPKKE